MGVHLSHHISAYKIYKPNENMQKESKIRKTRTPALCIVK